MIEKPKVVIVGVLALESQGSLATAQRAREAQLMAMHLEQQQLQKQSQTTVKKNA